MRLVPGVFWRLSLAEWRAVVGGHERVLREERYGRAWSSSYQLIAAGVDANKVTPEKLLGLPEPKRRRSRRATPAYRPLTGKQIFESLFPGKLDEVKGVE